MTAPTVQVSGDILATGVEKLAGYLACEDWRVRFVQSDEIELKGDVLEIAIYETEPEEDPDCLVSGAIDGDLDRAHAVVEAVARMLDAHRVVYHFELAVEGIPGNVRIVEHPDF